MGQKGISMAQTVEGAAQEALFARLAALVLSPVHPVAWPNLVFTKPADNRFLEARFVPNSVIRLLIDSDGPHQRNGFLQVNVRDAPNKGSVVVDVAGRVAAHFPADLQLQHVSGIVVRITAAAQVGPMMVEDTPPGVMVPVLVPFEFWA
jgi:Bacteriophage related domain of unknown function